MRKTRIFTGKLELAEFPGTVSRPTTLPGSLDKRFAVARISVNLFRKSSAPGYLPLNAAKPSSLPKTLPNSVGEHQITAQLAMRGKTASDSDFPRLLFSFAQ
jgi:hypothetical protein